MTITCPHGQTVEVEQVDGKTEYQRYRAHFDAGQCAGCPSRDRCLARAATRKPWRALSFDERDAEIARRLRP
ncbi:MAG: transposase [Chloroflexi bacterium]|nr:transposase [Chloroflexota bacterium]